jgi:hypothetical protein
LKNGVDSLNSFVRRAEYPQPLAKPAFHGLAGDIVRMIEPHTEADPAALLFQLLAGFGSLIGRTAYMIADGARHHLNIFGVLVGESSKGRKGTSWRQIENLLKQVDEAWQAERVTTGLSSGEGLIWAVRDPSEESKPIKDKGRHTGEYETVIVDRGISDKRLFVLEGEFANTLKVMERETNTLSPIIRQAWDSGILKTLVKNAPAKATDAHISIIGHITRDELLRFLNQTEAANGFANRFCWIAVRRSKCLPEGGQIGTVDFSGVVQRLIAAVAIANTVGEVKRSEAVRALWREVYPTLSEGKPGMLGAVTGRAESQVMRLSALFALLDGSTIIRPEHHYAAMALWEYCERSAGWIFGTNTGDKNADRILAALREAGPAGLTRTQISELFNRNLSSAILTNTLEILHAGGYVRLTSNVTGGAPAERWFSRSTVTK